MFAELSGDVWFLLVLGYVMVLILFGVIFSYANTALDASWHEPIKDRWCKVAHYCLLWFGAVGLVVWVVLGASALVLVAVGV